MWGSTMLYMGNVNRILFWLVIPLILCSFLIFRLTAWQYSSDGGRLSIANQHQVNINSKIELNCLILGGSNAVFSLSAEQISNNTELNCYNLSLLNEGYSFQSYWSFITSLSFDKDNIEHVFYSSVLPLRNEDDYYEKVKNTDSGIGIDGDKSFRLVDRSLASYLSNLLKGKGLFEPIKSYPLPNKYGDFNFSKYNFCRYGNDRNEYGSLYWQDIKLLKKWADSQLNEMKSLFTNANLYFLVPSVLYGKKYNDNHSETIKEIESAIKKFDNFPNKTVFIFEPAYNDASVICDAPHHANSIGREIRTRNLISNF